jgi:hypothetical protein
MNELGLFSPNHPPNHENTHTITTKHSYISSYSFLFHLNCASTPTQAKKYLKNKQMFTSPFFFALLDEKGTVKKTECVRLFSCLYLSKRDDQKRGGKNKNNNNELMKGGGGCGGCGGWIGEIANLSSSSSSLLPHILIIQLRFF